MWTRRSSVRELHETPAPWRIVINSFHALQTSSAFVWIIEQTEEEEEEKLKGGFLQKGDDRVVEWGKTLVTETRTFKDGLNSSILAHQLPFQYTRCVRRSSGCTCKLAFDKWFRDPSAVSTSALAAALLHAKELQMALQKNCEEQDGWMVEV